VSTLSGGERNRLLLARLFTQPANLLVMDEPTNDLDVETLELLEEVLLEYQGTLLLVSHDRAFLDHAVTSTLVFEGGGRIGEYVGGYSDWLWYQQNALGPMPEPSSRASTSAPAAMPSTEKLGVKSKKLSFKKQRELNDLPKQIESLEAEQAQLHARISEAAFYQQPGEAVTATLARLEQVTKELAACYVRWEALEAQATAE
jgi:ATP-binding cassette subfamily F protein uup